MPFESSTSDSSCVTLISIVSFMNILGEIVGIDDDDTFGVAVDDTVGDI